MVVTWGEGEESRRRGQVDFSFLMAEITHSFVYLLDIVSLVSICWWVFACILIFSYWKYYCDKGIFLLELLISFSLSISQKWTDGWCSRYFYNFLRSVDFFESMFFSIMVKLIYLWNLNDFGNPKFNAELEEKWDIS